MKQKSKKSVLFCLAIAILTVVVGCASTQTNLPQEIASMAKQNPTPAWLVQSGGVDIDLIFSMGGERLLVGDLEREAASSILQIPMIPIATLAHHIPAKLKLYDTENSKELWSLDRNELGPLPHMVLGISPAILILSGAAEITAKSPIPVKQLSAIDPATGSILWKRSISGEICLNDAQNAFYAVARDGKKMTIHSGGLSSGADIWKTEVQGFGSESAAVDFLSFAGDVFVADQGVVRIDSKGIKWKRDLSERISELSGTSSLIIACGVTSVFLLDAETGALKATINTGGKPGRVCTVEGSDRFFIISAESPTEESVRAISLDGKALWSTPTDLVKSSLTATASSIYLTTGKRVMSLSAKDGSTGFSAFFPSPLQSDILGPDTVRLAGDKITVAREIGVAVFSVKNGVCAFFERIQGAEAFGSNIAMIRTQEAVAAQIKRGTARAGVNGVFIAGNVDAFRSLAVSNYRYASAQYTAAQRTGSSGEISLAAANKSMAQTQQQVAESTAQTLQAVNAIQNATMGIINVTMAAFDDATGAVVKSINEDLGRKTFNAASLQLLSLSGKYYVRPYRTGSVGLAIVDLESHSRADILLAPDSALLNERQFISQIPLTLDADKGMIAVKAILPGPLTWAFQTVRNQNGVIYSVQDATRPSIARYKLAALAWKPVTKPIDQTAAVDTRSKQDLALLTAAASGDVAGVKKALAAGASINARDDQGRTALIHAARYPSMDMYKVLVAANPDPRILDIEGMGAWDYVNYPPRMLVEDRTDSVNMVGPLSSYYKKWERK